MADKEDVLVVRRPKRGGPLEVVGRVERLSPLAFRETRPRVILTKDPRRAQRERMRLRPGQESIEGKVIPVRAHLRDGDRIASHRRRPPTRKGTFVRDLTTPRPERILLTRPGPSGTRTVVGAVSAPSLEDFEKRRRRRR